MSETLNVKSAAAVAGAAPCSAADGPLADVEAALKLVKDSYIQNNKHRLGALGCADMDMVEEYLASARGKLLNDQSSPTGQ